MDIDGRRLGSRYPIEVGLVGDAGETLRALLPLLARRADGPGWRQVEQSQARWHRHRRRSAHALRRRGSIPSGLVRELSDAPARGCAGESGRRLGRLLVRAPPTSAARGAGAPVHRTLASMGSALPYGIAAKLALPASPARRARRRRRDADERTRRADHGRPPVARLGATRASSSACSTTATWPR